MPFAPRLCRLLARFLPILALAGSLAVVSRAPAATATDEVPDLRERLRTHHAEEAAGKTALAQAWAEGPSLRTANQNGWTCTTTTWI